MATPIFDSAIMALRRRVGDIYAVDGTEITTANVGTTGIGTTYKRDELVDIYNDAVRVFLDYVIRTIPKIDWNDYIHGYIFLAEAVTATSGVLDSPTDPPLYTVMDMMLHDAPNTLFIEVKPDQWFAFKTGLTKVRKNGYVVLSTGATWADSVREILLSPSDTESVDLIYIANHNDVIHGADTDLIGLSNTALQRILVIAEMLTRRYRSVDAVDEPLSQFQFTSQLDSQPQKD